MPCSSQALTSAARVAGICRGEEVKLKCSRLRFWHGNQMLPGLCLAFANGLVRQFAPVTGYKLLVACRGMCEVGLGKQLLVFIFWFFWVFRLVFRF